MATPSALAIPPQLWTALAAVLLGLLGLAVGRLAGRLVHLFGPAYPAQAPNSRGTRRTRRPASPVQDDATAPSGPVEGAPEEGTAPAGDRSTGDGTGGHGVDGPPEDDEGPPPARCPHCRAEVPFVRWLPTVASRSFHLRGSCPACDQAIPSHSGTTAATTALFALVGAAFLHQPEGSPFGLAAVLWLVALGAVLSAIDVSVLRLPDAIVVPAYPVAAVLLAAATLFPPAGPDLDRAAGALASMVLVLVLYWVLWRVYPAGLGFGDVKLSGLTGLYAGWAAGLLGALASVFWAFAAFSLCGLALMVLRRLTRQDPFPLGPFMFLATLATVLAGQPLVP